MLGLGHKGISAAEFLPEKNAYPLERKAAGQIVLKEAATGKSKELVENPGPAVGRAAKQVVPRLGPRDLDPIHHNANIRVRDASGRLRYHERIVSGI
jgi:hypothetical protein